MTFTEAAIEVLRREGKPLHFGKIAEIAVRENLLDHVGKVPEETMAGQLAAHCRLPAADRRIMPVQPGTFALVEWDLEEDPAGLDGIVEPPPEQELPYRSRERHPVPSRELSRAGGREGRGRRREEEERRGPKFPPPAEVAYEILAGAGRPLALAEIAAQGAERQLMPDAFVRDAGSLRAALAEDNRRRESAGRKALFQLDADAVTLVARPEPGERAVAAAPVAARAPSSAQELRRAGLAAIRRRLRDCDAPTVEHVVGKLLEKLGFRELKVAKRGREHVVYTGRLRMGLADVRHGIRILRGGADVARRDVGDLRRDLGHYGAQIGIVLSAGDAARDARGDAAAAGQLPVVLLCGEALAEAFADEGLGCVPVVVPDVDEAFFQAAAEVAEQEEAARRARREERERREPREGREGREGREPREGREGEQRRREEREEREPREPAAGVEGREGGEPTVREVRAFLESAAPGEAPAAELSVAQTGVDDDDADGEGEDEGPDDEDSEPGTKEPAAGAAAEGAEGERRRRRRRRRRRGGRGRGREGGAPEGARASVAGAPAEGSAPVEGGAPAGGPRAEGAPPPEPGVPATAPPPPVPGGEGGS